MAGTNFPTNSDSLIYQQVWHSLRQFQLFRYPAARLETARVSFSLFAMNFRQQIDASVRRCAGVCAVFVWLLSECGGEASVKGLYVGNDFYAPNEATQNAARASGFTRIFLSFLAINAHGDIYYNGIPVIQNGIYVGDPSWKTRLAALRKQPTGIECLELVIDGGDDSASSIKKLVAAQDTTRPDSALCKNFRALRDATGIDTVQLSDTPDDNALSVIAFGKMLGALNMKLTVNVFTNPAFWTSVKAQLGTNLDAVYLKCYAEGASNSPVGWAKIFGKENLYPGLWGNTDTPTSALFKLREWQQASGIGGAFFWLNGSMPDDASKWADVISVASGSPAPLRIINKNSGKSLNVLNGATTNGSPVHQAGYQPSQDQCWMLMPAENSGHFRLVSWVSGKSASIAFDSSLPGAQLWTWDYNYDPSQQFDLVDAGGGWFEIKNVRSELVLEVAGGSLAGNATVQQNSRSGAPYQLWRLLPFQPGLLAVENFDYPVGNLRGQNGGDGWNGTWSDDLNPGTQVVSNGLSSDTTGLGNSAFIPNNKRTGRYLDCSATGNFGVYGYVDANGRIGADDRTLYLSFWEQPAQTCMFYEFELNRGTERIAGIGNDTSKNTVSLRAPAATFTTVGEGTTNANFYVLRIDFKSGDDEVRVYRNPAPASEPLKPTLALTNAGDLSFNRISLAAFANTNSARFDQIRLASSWSSALSFADNLTINSVSNVTSADIFRQLQINGKVVCGSNGEYYLINGPAGLHVLLKYSTSLEPGDDVVVTGLVKRKGPFVELIEAEVKPVGHSSLPEPAALEPPRYDTEAIWVSVEGILTGMKDNGAELEMLTTAGSQKLTARFEPAAKTPAEYEIGSRIKLQGVYHRRFQSGKANQKSEGDFELLLNSPAAVQVIAHPPWWTFKRAALAMGMLGFCLLAAFIWIRLLHAQVARQTARLRVEITQREQAERARVIEAERSRISRDLHDDLGSLLTQINLLATTVPGARTSLNTTTERLKKISENSHRMMIALDEVVWMMNSRDESVSSLAAYLAAYTEEFLLRTNITCRIETPPTYPSKTVTAEIRNHIFSSVKEAINNAVRHARPQKISLIFSASEEKIEIQIQDDGTGFVPQTAEHGHGLDNLRMRMQNIGGGCEIQSSPSRGTRVIFCLPLSQTAE